MTSPMAASTPSATIALRPQSPSVVSYLFVTQSVFGEALFVSGELDGDAIVFIKMATNKPPLILRKWLSVEPSPAALAEQLAGIVRNQVCVPRPLDIGPDINPRAALGDKGYDPNPTA